MTSKTPLLRVDFLRTKEAILNSVLKRGDFNQYTTVYCELEPEHTPCISITKPADQEYKDERPVIELCLLPQAYSTGSSEKEPNTEEINLVVPREFSASGYAYFQDTLKNSFVSLVDTYGFDPNCEDHLLELTQRVREACSAATSVKNELDELISRFKTQRIKYMKDNAEQFLDEYTSFLMHESLGCSHESKILSGMFMFAKTKPSDEELRRAGLYDKVQAYKHKLAQAANYDPYLASIEHFIQNGQASENLKKMHKLGLGDWKRKAEFEMVNAECPRGFSAENYGKFQRAISGEKKDPTLEQLEDLTQAVSFLFKKNMLKSQHYFDTQTGFDENGEPILIDLSEDEVFKTALAQAKIYHLKTEEGQPRTMLSIPLEIDQVVSLNVAKLYNE